MADNKQEIMTSPGGETLKIINIQNEIEAKSGYRINDADSDMRRLLDNIPDLLEQLRAEISKIDEEIKILQEQKAEKSDAISRLSTVYSVLRRSLPNGR